MSSNFWPMPRATMRFWLENAFLEGEDIYAAIEYAARHASHAVLHEL